MEPSHSDSTQRLAVGLCIHSHLLPEEAFDTAVTLSSENSKSPRVILLILFFKPVMSGFTPGLWAL